MYIAVVYGKKLTFCLVIWANYKDGSKALNGSTCGEMARGQSCFESTYMYVLYNLGRIPTFYVATVQASSQVEK